MRHMVLNAKAIDRVRAGYDPVPGGCMLARDAVGAGLLGLRFARGHVLRGKG